MINRGTKSLRSLLGYLIDLGPVSLPERGDGHSVQNASSISLGASIIHCCQII